VIKAPTPEEVRDRIQDLVIRDLHGPFNGPAERLPRKGLAPSDRYVLGVLVPYGTKPEIADEATEVVDGDDVADDSSRSIRLQATSLGCTAVVDQSTATHVEVRAVWGSYEEEVLQDETGEEVKVWARKQIETPVGTILVPVQEDIEEDFEAHPDHPDVRIEVRTSASEQGLSVSAFLVNRQTRNKNQAKEPFYCFQAGIRLTTVDNGDHVAAFVPTTPALPSAAEDRHLAMLYRHELTFATGHGCAATGTDITLESRAATILTVAVPTAEVKRVDASDDVVGVVRDMCALATLPKDELVDSLRHLSAAYREWLVNQQPRLRTSDLASFDREARDALRQANQMADRLDLGIDVLANDPDALEAFRYTNRAMHQQRVRTTAAMRKRERGETHITRALVSEMDIPANRSWRLFQLAFVVLNIPALTDPAIAERSDDTQRLADLLFFPTGGGKTEAYLGLTAYTIAIRRLQAARFGFEPGAGVGVLMRYTLRLLTAQQFQRAAALIAACELERRVIVAALPDIDTRWDAPVRLGLWVGGSVSPNRHSAAKEHLEKAKSGKDYGASSVQITNCPWCDRDVSAGDDAEIIEHEQRIVLYCSDPLGACPFSKSNSPNEGIPTLTVDEYIYRYLPDLVISTVDKFAQLPVNGTTGALFGKVNRHCPRHGYLGADVDQYGLDCSTHKQIKSRGIQAATVRELDQPVRPPDLIIQDELHLITGPLGSIMGLYETAVDALTEWHAPTVNGLQPTRAKIIASTATIRRAGEQVRALFNRNLAVFPPPLLDADSTFFAEQQTDQPGRMYVGICARGERLKYVEVRLFTALLAAGETVAQELEAAGLDRQIVDAYLTVVGYFSSLRELGGMRRMADDDLRSKLNQLDTYTTKTGNVRPGRGFRNRRLSQPVELTSRMTAEQIIRSLEDLARPHSSEQRVKGYVGLRGVDLVLATNMISVGVDVPRLGTMIVVGQPKSASEYIQATSRVGRGSTLGLVFALYNWTRPRDMSHYERFFTFHRTFYREVEPLSVTPFAPGAVHRALTASLASIVRHGHGHPWQANADARSVITGSDGFKTAMKVFDVRAQLITDSALAANMHTALSDRQAMWSNEIARAKNDGAPLAYRNRTNPEQALLRDYDGGDWTAQHVPNSMRGVEAAVQVVLKPRSQWSKRPGPGTPQSEVLLDGGSSNE
jgi:hypothetical protein